MQPAHDNLSVFDAILARRSVRSYSAADVDRKAVMTLLEAAVRAPTAVHEEPWAFVVLQDRQRLRQISDVAKPLFAEEIARSGAHHAGHGFDVDQPDFNIFYDAGTLIVICAKPLGRFVEADCWLAAENIMLSACSMRLGSCVIGSAIPALNLPETKIELGIPRDYAAVVPLIVGHPASETPPSPRHPPGLLSWLH